MTRLFGGLVLLCAVALVARHAIADTKVPAREDTEVRRDAARAFLDAAQEAMEKGRADDVEKLLRAWASLGVAEGDLPVALEPQAVRAVAWAKQRGTFRLFASRLKDRVSAGVDDPAGLLAHLSAWVAEGETRHQLVRVEAERTDRWEYKLGADRSGTVVVVIEAVTTRLGGELPIARVVLVPQDTAPPPAPDPTKVTDTRPARPVDDVASDAPGLRWWWIAGGAIAVVLAGAAVWQETRF